MLKTVVTDVKEIRSMERIPNGNGVSYLSEDKRHYCYTRWDVEKNCFVTEKYEIDVDITVDMAAELNASDDSIDLNNRYQRELLDPLYLAKLNNRQMQSDQSAIADLLDEIADGKGSIEDILMLDEEAEDPRILVIRHVIQNLCTESQQNLFYDYYGMHKQLTTMRAEEAARTGKKVSEAAMSQRKNRIIEKCAKELGVERTIANKSQN